jgi:hypothetical protein
MMKRPTIALIVVALLVLLAGCDESLPPRDEPLRILSGSFGIVDTFVVVNDSMPIGTMGAFVSRVRNLYEDVLEDTALIQVDYTVVLEEMPDTAITFRATRKDILSTEVLNGALVTIKPNAEVVVRTRWSHHTNAGTPIWRLFPLHMGADPGGRIYYQSDDIEIRVSCSIRTFKRLPAIVQGPIRLLLIYRYFPPAAATPIMLQ